MASSISQGPAVVSGMALSSLVASNKQGHLASRTAMAPYSVGSLGGRFTRVSMQSSFLNSGASSLQLQTPSRRGGVCQGRALTVEANLFERLVRVVKSYANAAVTAAEDPEKLLDQTVLEMNEDLSKMRQASAQVLAAQKQLENKYKAAQTTADDWYRRAKLALEKGDEMLAKEALKRRKDYEDNAISLRTQLDQQKGIVDKLIANTRILESKIQEAKSKKDTLKARALSAKTSQKVNEMVGSINTSSALAAFEKMEEKVLAMEAEAEAVGQLSTDDLSSKFALLEGSSGVDDDLEALKKEVRGVRGELPPGRYEPSTKDRFDEMALESELKEMRRKL